MEQKKLTVLTLFVVVAGAVAINEFIIHNSNFEQNREVASFGERNEPEQIKWEQELAKTVSQETGKTLLGAKPSLNEKFLFETLEGKYQASFLNGNILKISLLPNQSALELNTENLIQKYSSLFKGAKTFEKSNSSASAENIILKNSEGKSIGTAVIMRNDQGRVTQIEIQ